MITGYFTKCGIHDKYSIKTLIFWFLDLDIYREIESLLQFLEHNLKSFQYAW